MDTVFIWLGIALVAGVSAFVVYDDWPRLVRRQVRAQGTVIDHRRDVDDGSENFTARVRFMTPEGNAVEVMDYVLKSTPTPPVGTAVSVVYPSGML